MAAAGPAGALAWVSIRRPGAGGGGAAAPPGFPPSPAEGKPYMIPHQPCSCEAEEMVSLHSLVSWSHLGDVIQQVRV